MHGMITAEKLAVIQATVSCQELRVNKYLSCHSNGFLNF